MGSSHTESFTAEHLALANLFKALGHPARLAIVHALAAQTACICGEFVEVTGLSQATVSQHLNELKSAGLIQGSIQGPKTCYCLAPKTLALLSASIAQLQSPEMLCC
jgi:DNA-binding transcriptional ArsR family regulator